LLKRPTPAGGDTSQGSAAALGREPRHGEAERALITLLTKQVDDDDGQTLGWRSLQAVERHMASSCPGPPKDQLWSNREDSVQPGRRVRSSRERLRLPPAARPPSRDASKLLEHVQNLSLATKGSSFLCASAGGERPSVPPLPEVDPFPPSNAKEEGRGLHHAQNQKHPPTPNPIDLTRYEQDRRVAAGLGRGGPLRTRIEKSDRCRQKEPLARLWFIEAPGCEEPAPHEAPEKPLPAPPMCESAERCCLRQEKRRTTSSSRIQDPIQGPEQAKKLLPPLLLSGGRLP